ncbi:hypothetical protein GALMADRAFT_230903 [Galerina marginata CBS 339.88]|uniref:DUF4100 domain-containing protein n=1 Tax=Galerina marginata (strain CBS 339.88) TaxID=685588 RepID=A0A067SGH9_GALM3|nr:hypothetical protein GALMADRAFT_230903 [Galerina marginata CBS 339.88]
MTTPLMPVRGERGAPIFDAQQPAEIKRFFDQLDTLFTRSAITNEADKKKYTIRYADYSTADLWEAIPEYSDVTKTYDDFKKAIISGYIDEKRKYSVSDLDLLVGERQRLGIHSQIDLTNYHFRFQAISSHLIESKRIGEVDQFNAYIRGFSPSFWSQVQVRLHIKYPDHYLDDTYKISEVFDAAQFVLRGPNAISHPSHVTPSSPLPQTPQTSTSLPSTIKTEELGSIFKSILEALQNTSTRRPASSSGNYSSNPQDLDCAMCAGPHFIRDCQEVEKYIQEGKCKRNTEGKVVLPSGSFVPRTIPGKYLRERLDEWHRRNPGQLAAGNLFHAVTSPSAFPQYQLSATDRIAVLEAELFNLKARHKPGFVPVIRTRAQKARNPDINVADEPQSTPEPIPTLPEPAPAVPTSTSTQNEPEHPFRNAPDASYAPPQDRNFGTAPAAPSKASAAKKPEPAYRTLPPIHEAAIANTVYNRALDTPVTITQRELLSISPEVRSQIREAVTTRRIPTKDSKDSQEAYLGEQQDEISSTLDELPFGAEHTGSIAIPSSQHRSPPPGSIVIPDPIETYYRTLRPGESPDPDRIVVAKESFALRSIFPLVDNSQKVECILDPGCQIVAMSEDICHDLSVVYDPTIKLNMQSANGSVDQSLGLARNVPFLIGGLTLYMQVHVIRSPAYDILLGRPFDVLTESIIRNYANEDQTITIHDPNSNRTVTVPTSPRGLHRTCQHIEAVFQR